PGWPRGAGGLSPAAGGCGVSGAPRPPPPRHRTGGRSAFYQAALNGFGLHGLVHLGQAAATRGYTPGVVTSPLLVVPFTLWARGRLRRAGVLRPVRVRDAVQGLALAAVAAAGSQAVARRLG
ncbi:HXXEE domain-containing protein, partial [Streptomyces sp. NPDC059456]|uniref:HXXEE domain-containing protein n=1 Tax=Streptomyces sp. NPDC059456 TaxID=3346838 RepID=UPI00368FED12